MKNATLSTSGLASHGGLELGVPGVAGVLGVAGVVGTGITGLSGVGVGEAIIDRLDRVENVRPIRFVPREKDPSSRSSLTIAEIRAESERVLVLPALELTLSMAHCLPRDFLCRNLPLETLLNRRLL